MIMRRGSYGQNMSFLPDCGRRHDLEGRVVMDFAECLDLVVLAHGVPVADRKWFADTNVDHSFQSFIPC